MSRSLETLTDQISKNGRYDVYMAQQFFSSAPVDEFADGYKLIVDWHLKAKGDYINQQTALGYTEESAARALACMYMGYWDINKMPGVALMVPDLARAVKEGSQSILERGG